MSNYTKTTDFEAKDSLPTGDSGKIIRGAEFETEFDAIATAITTKADTAGPTFTGTLTFETISDGTIGVTAFVDEDNMASDSATLVPTQQSVKAYVDSQVTAQDLDFQADSGGALSIDLDSETLTFTGGAGIDTSGSGNAVTFAIDSTVATLTGTQTLTNKTLTAPTISGNLTTDGTIDGRDVATDGAKLDGIEAGATADQTAAEIRTLVESASDSNVFTDADHSKLDGIEASATADQTNAEIRAAVEAATDSNVFTDADHTKLDGIEASADVTDTANVTAAGALMDSEVTNLAQVKAFDSSDYATAAQGSTADSALQNVVEDTTPQLGGDLASNGNDILFGDNDKAIFGVDSDLSIYSDGTASTIQESGPGALNIQGTHLNLRNAAGSASYLAAIDGGAVTLYNSGSAKLATTSTGIDVTGSVTADGLTVDGTGDLGTIGNGAFNAAAALGFQSDRAFFGYSSSQNALIQSGASKGVAVEVNSDTLDSGTRAALFASNGDISFYEDTGTTAKLFWDAADERLFIGATSASALNSYSDDLIISNTTLGTGAGISIVSNASNGYSNIHFGDTDDADIARIQYNNATNEMTFRTNATDAVTIDDSQNVGIGTDSPNSYSGFTTLTLDGTSGSLLDLEVNGTVTGEIYADTSFGIGLQAIGSRDIQFKTNNTERMRIDSRGAIGFGTTPPSDTHTGWNQFFIGQKASLFSENATGTHGLDGTFITDNLYVDSDTGSFANIETNQSSAYRQEASEHIWYSQASGSAGAAVTLDEKMRIDSSGNVGIGTSLPAFNLTTQGSSGTVTVASKNTGGNASVYIEASNTNTAKLELAEAGTGSYSLQVGNDDALMFFDDSSERMRIDSSGVVQISNATPTLKFTDTDNNYDATIQGLSGSLVLKADSGAEFGTESIQFRTGGDEAARIDTSGNLLVGLTGVSGIATGATADNGVYLDGPEGVVVAQSNSNRNLYLSKATGYTDPDFISFYVAGSPVGSITIESDGFAIDGETLHTGWKFYENAIGPRKNGTLADDTVDLGWQSNRFDDIYATNGTIQTSDRNEKQDIEALSEAEQRVAVACKGLLRKFRWKSSVADKGDDARIHFGIIAQDLQDAFTAEGLDAGRYAMFISTTWTDEDTGEERTRMGVRYSELLAFIIAAI